MEYVQNTLHLKAGNKTVLIYIYETHPLDFLFSIILHDKMDFLLTIVFLDIMKPGGYARQLL